MASAYSGTIGHLRTLVQQGQLEASMRASYESHFGGASPSLVNSWLASIPAFLDILNSSEFESVGILLELRMPIGDERADAVLLGGSSDEPKGIVVEMKQWSSFKETASSLFVDVPVEGKQEHPSAQALNYEGKLKNLHSVGQHYDWKSVCLMHNLPSNYKSTLHDSYDPELVGRAPIFGKDDIKSFAEYCSKHLCPTKLKKNDVNKFDAAAYEQTKSFFDIIRNSSGDIAKNVTTAIADTGAGLTSEQELLAEEVLVSASNGEEKVFMVQGSPGSGKSLVAVHLLLKALARQLRSLLALRNNRLMTILRECLNKASPGASGATIYSSVPRSQRGLGDSGCNWFGDLVVCDETQRFNDKNLPVIMQRAPTVVFFYDESQILNPPEQGTKENFLKHASQLGKTVEERGLTSFMRCRGGTEYHEWVEGLISLKEGNETSGGTPWHNKYEFSVTDDIQSLISYLGKRREQNKVAMVASFTESKGKMKARFHQDNIRIGHPLSSGFDIYRGTNLTIPWLMDPKSDYTPFWLEGESNNLDTVSSIYGCQGFESDYVGVVWGRDFIRRGNSWKIGDSKIITDNIDGLQTSTRNDPELALKLLQNRYRIFLTRGMLGTIIFCEDAETGKYLKNQLSKSKKDTSSSSTKVPDEKKVLEESDSPTVSKEKSIDKQETIFLALPEGAGIMEFYSDGKSWEWEGNKYIELKAVEKSAVQSVKAQSRLTLMMDNLNDFSSLHPEEQTVTFRADQLKALRSLADEIMEGSVKSFLTIPVNEIEPIYFPNPKENISETYRYFDMKLGDVLTRHESGGLPRLLFEGDYKVISSKVYKYDDKMGHYLIVEENLDEKDESLVNRRTDFLREGDKVQCYEILWKDPHPELRSYLVSFEGFHSTKVGRVGKFIYDSGLTILYHINKGQAPDTIVGLRSVKTGDEVTVPQNALFDLGKKKPK